jgi:hypothetical protein
MSRVEHPDIRSHGNPTGNRKGVQNYASFKGQNPLGLDMWLWVPPHGNFKVMNLSISRVWFKLLKVNNKTLFEKDVVLGLRSSVKVGFKIRHWEMKSCHPAISWKLTLTQGIGLARNVQRHCKEFQKLISFLLDLFPFLRYFSIPVFRAKSCQA